MQAMSEEGIRPYRGSLKSSARRVKWIRRTAAEFHLGLKEISCPIVKFPDEVHL